MDYTVYRLTLKEWGKCIGLAALITGLIAFLFYSSAWAVIIFPFLLVFLYKREKKRGAQRVQDELAGQFLDALRTVSASLMAGMSMENAWRDAGKEIAEMYGDDAVMTRELAEINRGVELNVPLEEMLEDLAARSGNPDISSFSEVFSFAKRSGGNFPAIIEGTVGSMRMRFETEREIQTLIASKKFEQNIMNLVPMLILAYLRVTSAGLLDVLYGNSFGVMFMSGCLAAYGVAILLSEKIMKIKV